MRALTLLASLLMAAPTALATDAPTHRAELLAWSDDGMTALVRETSTIPAGGGQRALRLLSARGAKRVILSQIDNPNAKRAQKVSDRACASRLRSFGKLLAKRGFTDVSVAVTCADRATLVTIGRAAAARVADTWFSGRGTHQTRDALTVSLRDNVLELGSDGKLVGRWPNTPQPLEIRAALSPSGSVIVVVHQWEPGNSGVLAVLASKTGLAADFKRARL